MNRCPLNRSDSCTSSCTLAATSGILLLLKQYWMRMRKISHAGAKITHDDDTFCFGAQFAQITHYTEPPGAGRVSHSCPGKEAMYVALDPAHTIAGQGNASEYHSVTQYKLKQNTYSAFGTTEHTKQACFKSQTPLSSLPKGLLPHRVSNGSWETHSLFHCGRASDPKNPSGRTVELRRPSRPR